MSAAARAIAAPEKEKIEEKVCHGCRFLLHSLAGRSSLPVCRGAAAAPAAAAAARAAPHLLANLLAHNLNLPPPRAAH